MRGTKIPKSVNIRVGGKCKAINKIWELIGNVHEIEKKKSIISIFSIPTKLKHHYHQALAYSSVSYLQNAFGCQVFEIDDFLTEKSNIFLPICELLGRNELLCFPHNPPERLACIPFTFTYNGRIGPMLANIPSNSNYLNMHNNTTDGTN